MKNVSRLVPLSPAGRVPRSRRRSLLLLSLLSATAVGLGACHATEDSSPTPRDSAALAPLEESQESQSNPVIASKDPVPTSSPEDEELTRGSSSQAGHTPLGDANTAMKTQRPEAPGRLAVTKVRVGAHDGFDRVVFDLSGDGHPGWHIDYDTHPTQQGSGHCMEYEGTIALNVNIDNTTYPYELGLDDPHIQSVPGVGEVVEIISAGVFEGRSQFIIGLRAKHPYVVKVLDNPTRLVIDVTHDPTR